VTCAKIQVPSGGDWFALSQNPEAIYLLEKNVDKIHWYGLSRNPKALPLLEKHFHRIHWNGFA
jgi:hypothetical protein